MTPWIALTGRARAGKDTVAAHLVAEHGYTRIGFADPLKQMALAVNPIVYTAELPARRLADVVDLIGWEMAKDGYPEVRRVLQCLGTEGGRHIFGPNVWADLAEQAAEAVDGPVVFSDCRFPNEADMVERHGGLLVRVIRPALAVGGAPHVSETALDDRPCRTVLSDDTIGVLQQRTDQLIALLEGAAA